MNKNLGDWKTIRTMIKMKTNDDEKRIGRKKRKEEEGEEEGEIRGRNKREK